MTVLRWRILHSDTNSIYCEEKTMKTLPIRHDSAVIDLTLDKWINELPNIRKFSGKGSYEPLASTPPPITVPS